MKAHDKRGGFTLYRMPHRTSGQVYGFSAATTEKFQLADQYQSADEAWNALAANTVGSCGSCLSRGRITPLVFGNAYPSPEQKGRGGRRLPGRHVCGICFGRMRDPAVPPAVCVIALDHPDLGLKAEWRKQYGCGWIDLDGRRIERFRFRTLKDNPLMSPEDEQYEWLSFSPLPQPHGDGLVRVHGGYRERKFLMATHVPELWDGFPGFTRTGMLLKIMRPTLH